ncbi:hypothetical protein BT63DRAFT_458422 [Microthyrium microscopicum]|uniref:Uncharacterized protein n=1 Tax=Microthyrium microscopicum TaxID=703497 RepID=A0A6A6U3P5_9PEZI|nr:hypothetical protein BT63DRAFT_458422 [Microthyrium microscopicum]
MKSIAVSAVLAASSVQGYLIPPNTHKIDWRLEQKRQIVGTITNLLGKGGKVADPAGFAPKRVVMETTSKVAGVKRIKMRYGPYMVPNMNKTSLVGESGMLWNYPDLAIPKPCTECTIVAQVAGLEYPDGKNANINTGMWLHHMVQLAIGPGRWDPTCYGRMSLPHFDVNASPSNSERYFSSGNERTLVPLDILGTSTNWGYHVKSTDKFGFIVDLMNMNMEDKTVYLTMTYDIVDGPLPAGWKDVKVVWFDANQCGTSEVMPPKQSGSFTITSGKWVPNFEGEPLGIGAHLHDGGASAEVMYGPGKSFCKSNAAYAEKPEYIAGSHAMANAQPGGHAHGVASKHISSMTVCFTDGKGGGIPVQKLSKDQSWFIQGRYDYDANEGNKNGGGTQDEVMAIALMYVKVEPGVKPASKTPVTVSQPVIKMISE